MQNIFRPQTTSRQSPRKSPKKLQSSRIVTPQKKTSETAQKRQRNSEERSPSPPRRSPRKSPRKVQPVKIVTPQKETHSQTPQKRRRISEDSEERPQTPPRQPQRKSPRKVHSPSTSSQTPQKSIRGFADNDGDK